MMADKYYTALDVALALQELDQPLGREFKIIAWLLDNDKEFVYAKALIDRRRFVQDVLFASQYLFKPGSLKKEVKRVREDAAGKTVKFPVALKQGSEGKFYAMAKKARIMLLCHKHGLLEEKFVRLIAVKLDAGILFDDMLYGIASTRLQKILKECGLANAGKSDSEVWVKLAATRRRKAKSKSGNPASGLKK